MKLAINFSQEAADLVETGAIPLDLFKSPNWPFLVAEASKYRPVAVHFDIKVGGPQPVEFDWDSVKRFRQETGTPFVNAHMNSRNKDFPKLKRNPMDPASIDQVTRCLVADLKSMARRFGAENVIAENVPYRGEEGKVIRPCVEPDVISRVIEESGCGLLLDISHARIAAHYLGMDEREYMERLPVKSIRELHYTGLQWVDWGLSDHLPIRDEDWPVLEWVLEKIKAGEWGKPWMLAFEYGGVGGDFEGRTDKDVIAVQVPRLYELVNAI